jgi:hypothetical protein
MRDVKSMSFLWLMIAAGCSRPNDAPDKASAPEPAASASVSGADSSATCAATTLDGAPIASAPAPADGRGGTDFGACRSAIEAQVRAAVCAGGGPPAYMFRMGAVPPIKVPVVCSAAPVAASAPTTTAVATPTTAALARAAPGGVGTCSAMRLDGSLIAVEAAPSTGITHDYVACRAKIEPKIKAVVCQGKTGGVSASYLYKISSNAAVKSSMLCR